MKLLDYVMEIFDIAKENGVSWDVGMDMFMANVANIGKENYVEYKGANVDYSTLDYSVLNSSRQEFMDVIQKDIYDENDKRVSSVYKEFYTLRNAGKLDEAKALIEAHTPVAE